MTELFWYALFPIVVIPLSAYLTIRLGVFAFYRGRAASRRPEQSNRNHFHITKEGGY